MARPRLSTYYQRSNLIPLTCRRPSDRIGMPEIHTFSSRPHLRAAAYDAHWEDFSAQDLPEVAVLVFYMGRTKQRRLVDAKKNSGSMSVVVCSALHCNRTSPATGHAAIS